MIAVNGWYSANQRMPLGIDSSGMKVLLRKGSSRLIGRTMLLAPSAVLLFRPSAIANQVRAKVSATSNPLASSQSVTDAFGRNPIRMAKPTTRARLTVVTITLPSTCPASTAGRKIAIVRNLATMPSVMSIAAPTAGDIVPDAIDISRMPGVRKSM